MPFRRRFAAALAAAGLGLAAAPAAAANWLVTGVGTLFQTPTPAGETRLDGSFFEGQIAAFVLVIDDSVTPFDNMPPGGTGQSRTYPGAVTAFGMAIGGFEVTRRDGAPASLFLLNDVAPTATLRLDQLSYSEGFLFSAGTLTPWLETDAPLPPAGFISGFNFGRSAVTTAPALPGLLASAALPPLDSIWQPGAAGMFLGLDVRAGTPTTVADLPRLPRARFQARDLQFAVSLLPDTPAVPEPASWALMIAGFGLVGAAARCNRRARSPA